MEVKGIEWVKGYIKCSLKSRHIELFINSALKNRLNIWDFKMIAKNSAVFYISLRDFFELKPILRSTQSKIHVEKRNGLPFLVKRLFRRKGIILGFIFFITIVYMLSSMIWSISIEGNNKVKDEEIYEAVQEIGIHEGMFKFQLPNQQEIQSQLLLELDNISWVGVKVRGTKLEFKVIEKVRPEERESTYPRNIISKKNAVIYKILAEEGLPQVKVNDRVKKGDILISGIMGSEEKQELVRAEGTVWGVVWYESKVTLPLKQQWSEYTGNIIEKKYISFKLGNRMIKYKGPKEIPYQRYEKQYDWKILSWRNYQLPVVFVTEKNLEYEEKEKMLSEDEAIKIALEQTKKNLSSKIKADNKILSEKVLHQSVDNGKLTIKVLYEVLEDITATEPIVIKQGE